FLLSCFLLLFDLYHGVADNFIAELVAGLHFFANNFGITIAIFHADSFVINRVKNFTNSFNSFYTDISKRLLKLLYNALDTFNIIIALEFFWCMLKRSLKIVDYRQQIS